MTRTARHAFVSGRVQGVAFRWYARERATELGLAGWVRNLPDGRVEAWLEGEPRDVARMVTWLNRGPSAARVTGLDLSEVDPAGHAVFEIRHGSA